MRLTKNSRVWIFYHGADFDGWASGVILKNFFHDLGIQSIDIPYLYGEDFAVKFDDLKEVFLDKLTEENFGQTIHVLDMVNHGDLITFVDCVPFQSKNCAKFCSDVFSRSDNPVLIIDHHRSAGQHIKDSPGAAEYYNITLDDNGIIMPVSTSRSSVFEGLIVDNICGVSACMLTRLWTLVQNNRHYENGDIELSVDNDTIISILNDIKHSGPESKLPIDLKILEQIARGVICLEEDVDYVWNHPLILLSMYDTHTIGDSKLWDDQILPFQYGMRSFDINLKHLGLRTEDSVVDKILYSDGNTDGHMNFVKHTIDRGKGILGYVADRNRKLRENHHVFKMVKFHDKDYGKDGHFEGQGLMSDIVVAMDFQNNSKVFEDAYSVDELQQFYGGLLIRPDLFNKDGTYLVTLMTGMFDKEAADVDASEMMKIVGGGGHKGIAGATVRLMVETEYDDNDVSYEILHVCHREAEIGDRVTGDDNDYFRRL